MFPTPEWLKTSADLMRTQVAFLCSSVQPLSANRRFFTLSSSDKATVATIFDPRPASKGDKMCRLFSHFSAFAAFSDVALLDTRGCQSLRLMVVAIADSISFEKECKHFL